MALLKTAFGAAYNVVHMKEVVYIAVGLGKAEQMGLDMEVYECEAEIF